MIGKQPYTKAVAITPSDTVNFVNQGTSDLCCSSIYVGGAGVVQVVFQDGSVAAYTAVAGGTLDVKAKRVNSTGTTATLLLAQYHV